MDRGVNFMRIIQPTVTVNIDEMDQNKIVKIERYARVCY